jgi:hypothetical protein
VTDSVTAALTATNEITITVVNSGRCGGVPALPTLSLLAIPLSALPADEITVKLLHPGMPTYSAKAMVDLRQPLDIHTDLPARISDVKTAISAAERDARSRVAPGQAVSFLAVDADRWTETGLGCPVQGKAYQPADARGFVIFFSSTDQAQPMEYHISGANLAFCGRVALTTVVG